MTSAIYERVPPAIDCADLASIPRHQYLIELAMPLPWLAFSWALYASALWPLGAIASFLFFLCCLRLNHEAIHGNLGLGRTSDRVIMHALSALMLGSNHASAFCHLQHHRDALGHDDHEGHCAHMKFWQVLRYGPLFPLELNRAAWAKGSEFWRRRIVGDWLCIALFVGICLATGPGFLWLHLAAMTAGQCLAAFFAVWITHHDTVGTGLAGRSQRGLVARFAYLMFYHREHHLFPRVPVSRLPELAARLDRDVPGYADARLPVTRFLDKGPIG